MSSHWPLVALSDIAEIHRDSVDPARLGEMLVNLYSIPSFDRDGQPEVVSAAEIGSSKLRVPVGATLVSRLNPHIPRIWAPAVPEEGENLCSPEFAVLTATGCDPAFLPYSVAGDAISGRLKEYANGTSSSHQRVKPADLMSLRAPLPPPEVQKEITELLATLDARIDTTRALERDLGLLMEALYRAALEEGVSGSEISLVEAVVLTNGGAYTKGAEGEGRIVIRIKDLNSGLSETTVRSKRDAPADKTAFPGDVLFAWSGTLGVWRWYRDEAIINQHIFKVTANRHPVWLGWLHVRAALSEFQHIAAGKATTMGHVTRGHLERTLVPHFEGPELDELSQKIEPLWDMQLRAGLELEELRSFRAFVLPRLVSGELEMHAPKEGQYGLA